MKKMVIWGASGHASVVADIIRLRGEYEIAGFIDNINASRHGETFCGAPVISEAQLGELSRSAIEHMIVGFGDCAARLRLGESLRAKGFKLVTAIHPSATVAADATVGDGTVLAAGAVINPGARIGRDVIINTLASVDHDCVVHDGAHVGPGVRLAGKVTVGRAAWIGIGAAVIDRVTIGEGAIIGAGAVVVNDVREGVLAYGVPAKIKKELNPGK